MTEIKTELKTFRLTKRCHACNTGFLEYEPALDFIPFSSSDPNIFSHKCSNNNCTHIEVLSKRYPSIVYEDVVNITHD